MVEGSHHRPSLTPFPQARTLEGATATNSSGGRCGENAWGRTEGLAGEAGKLRQPVGEVGKVQGKRGIRTGV